MLVECILKEVIIDILNDPQYENRNITFSCKENIILYKFDHILMKRAFNNLLINSVIHNSSETEINVSIERKDKVYILIKDNGKGIESKVGEGTKFIIILP